MNTTNSILMLDLFSIGFKYNKLNNEMEYCFGNKYKLIIDMNARNFYGEINGQVVAVEYLMEKMEADSILDYKKCTSILSDACDAIIKFNSQF